MNITAPIPALQKRIKELEEEVLRLRQQRDAANAQLAFVYQIQAENTIDQVVQARAEGKADVQQLLMDYCKRKKG